jgi:hypothetical protein
MRTQNTQIPRLPDLSLPDGVHNAEEYLRQSVFQGLERRDGSVREELRTRAEREFI